MILCNEDFEKEQTVIIVVPYNYCEFTTIFGFVMVGTTLVCIEFTLHDMDRSGLLDNQEFSNNCCTCVLY